MKFKIVESIFLYEASWSVPLSSFSIQRVLKLVVVITVVVIIIIIILIIIRWFLNEIIVRAW